MRAQENVVCWILGTAYSGSSLLNLLLDGQPGVRGLGEAIHLILNEGKPWCSRCREELKHCPLKKAVDKGEFYNSIFRFYGDCDILIDSSKWWRYCAIDHGVEKNVRYKAILLSKLPHEYADSRINHNGKADAREAFLDWIQCYRSTWRAANNSPQLGRDDMLCLSYGRLAGDPAGTVQQVCKFLDVKFNPESHAKWWETDSHIMGGNNSVYEQSAGSNWFSTNEDYLQGKYFGKYRKVFLDEHWRTNPVLMQKCAELYAEFAKDLDPLLKLSGHADCMTQIQQIAWT